MARAAAQRLQQEIDISHNEMLGVIDAKLGAMEDRLTDGQAILHSRINDIAKDVTSTALAVARIEGAREAEQRLTEKSRRPWLKWSLAGVAVTVTSGLAVGWQTLVHVAVAVSSALLATPH